MRNLKNFLNKREQSQARLSFAECEKSRLLAKLTLTLVALLAMTAGAWADGVKIKFAANGKEKVVTVESLPHTFWCKNDNASDELDLILQELYDWPNDNGDNYYCYIYEPYPSASGNDKVTAGIDGINHYVTIAEGFEGSATVTGKYQILGSVATYELAISPAPPAGTALKPDATRKVWTLDAMPAGNVELQVAYFPGMLTLPAKTAQGSIEVVGLGGETLPAGFDTDGTNYYVEPKTQFQVKAVPAEGYHLVSLSDGTNTYDVDADGIATVTMPEGDADLTLTATFSDEFELTFDDVNFKTNQNITVKVGDADKTLDQDGKLSVKAGQTVTLTAKQGYKFRSVEAKKAAEAPATVLSGALVDGAIIKVNFKWRGSNFGDYVQGVYNAASGTFTTSKGGDYWGGDNRAMYKVEKSGDNIIIGACFKNYDYEGMVWTFNTTNDTYTTTKGQLIDDTFGLISVTLNGTDITSQLTAQ